VPGGDTSGSGTTGSLRRGDGGLNQGGSSLDRDTTNVAAGGDTVQDNDEGQGGILSTIGR
jgi:hypothetical protein